MTYTGDLRTVDASSTATEQLFLNLVDSYEPWSTLYVPVTLSLESPKKMSISGRATMVYGESIYISLRMIGMELGVIYIDDESIYVVDKFHKAYFTEEIARLLGDINFTIKDLQDLLLGRPIVPGNGILTQDDSDQFTFLASEQQWLLTPVQQIKGAEWHYLAEKTDPPILSAISLRLESGPAVECRFSEPTNSPAGVVEGINTITLPFKEENLVISIIWSLDDAKWNTERTVNFSAPSASYKRLDKEALLRSVDNL